MRLIKEEFEDSKYIFKNYIENHSDEEYIEEIEGLEIEPEKAYEALTPEAKKELQDIGEWAAKFYTGEEEVIDGKYLTPEELENEVGVSPNYEDWGLEDFNYVLTYINGGMDLPELFSEDNYDELMLASNYTEDQMKKHIFESFKNYIKSKGNSPLKENKEELSFEQVKKILKDKHNINLNEKEFENLSNLKENKESNKCALCGKEIIGYGNNGMPLVDGSVCDECNDKVIEARIEEIMKSKEDSSLEEEKKKEQGYFVKYNSGDVEKGTEFFNKNMGTNDSTSEGTVAENLAKDKKSVNIRESLNNYDKESCSTDLLNMYDNCKLTLEDKKQIANYILKEDYKEIEKYLYDKMK